MRERLYSHRVELAAQQQLEVTVAAQGDIEGFEVEGETGFWVERIVPFMYENIVGEPVSGDQLGTLDLSAIQHMKCRQFTFTFRGRALSPSCLRSASSGVVAAENHNGTLLGESGVHDVLGWPMQTNLLVCDNDKCRNVSVGHVGEGGMRICGQDGPPNGYFACSADCARTLIAMTDEERLANLQAVVNRWPQGTVFPCTPDL